MKILYIGQNTLGTTSKMRADIIGDILKPSEYHVFDTNLPYNKTSRFWKSIGFRYKFGMLVGNINNYISNQLNAIFPDTNFDLIWIDKGIFIKRHILLRLKQKSTKLVHFTPDMAFYKNRSKHFTKNIDLYDFVITTKSEEMKFYQKHVSLDKILLTTQGYSKDIHRPIVDYDNKDGTVAFIGLAERSRIQLVQELIDANIKVKLAGSGWDRFAKKNRDNINFTYFGKGLYSDNYSEFISSASMGLGLLSKKFPELHTTRTFEIPACRTALLTEKNKETSKFFDESNAIFFKDADELVAKINFFKANPSSLQKLTDSGYHNVLQKKFDYYSIIANVLDIVFSKKITGKV